MEDVSKLVKDKLSEIIHYSKYARYLPEEKRRETFEETVERNKQMHLNKFPHLKDKIDWAYEFVEEKKILPSMRSFQFAGKAIEVNPTRMYNCSYLPVDHWHAFSEVMFLLLSGTGTGLSVQKHHVDKLPEVVGPSESKRRYVIDDSIVGWANAVKTLMKAYFFGRPKPVFDYSDIRPKGARLITSGGKAPGPEPLKICLNKISKLLDDVLESNNGQPRKLKPIEVHDIMCVIADAVLAGGIRRAAMISLFSPDDEEMLYAKSSFIPVQEIISKEYPYHTDVDGLKPDTNRLIVTLKVDDKKHTIELYRNETGEFDYLDDIEDKKVVPWFLLYPYRGRANNSVVLLRERTTKEDFERIFKILEESGSGEPGFFWTNDPDLNIGVNPCSEISLSPYQFCNLTTINGTTIESQEDLNERARAAAFIATLQATYTDFHFLREKWKTTTERDYLIGVSITGIASGRLDNLNLREAAEIAKKENEETAKLVNIKPAARVTTLKPEGTSSLLLSSSSGIHPWYSHFYIRNVRVNKNEPLYKYLAEKFPTILTDDYFAPESTAVISFPIKAPNGALTRHDETALGMLERVKKYNLEWIRPGHRSGPNYNNVSVTVYVRPHEWDEVKQWMWENRDTYTAISLLPHDGGTYIQAPHEEISEEEYYALLTIWKDAYKINTAEIIEDDDNTNLQGELACAGGACEVTNV